MFNIMNMCSISTKKKANIRPNDGMKIVKKIDNKETCAPVKLVRLRLVRKMRLDCIPISAKRLRHILSRCKQDITMGDRLKTWQPYRWGCKAHAINLGVGSF
jgi:hypothetical protein